MPDGWKLVAVNEAFDGLMVALGRAERKGYMPDAVAEDWGLFEWNDRPAAPTPAEKCLTCNGRGTVGMPNIDELPCPDCLLEAEPAPYKLPRAIRERLDDGVDALSEVLAYVKLDRLEPKVSRALSRLRAVQALEYRAPAEPVQQDTKGADHG